MTYPVYTLSVKSESPEIQEQIGSKPKFWFLKDGDPEQRWLFKYSRVNTGEAWAEKAAAEIAGLMELPHAGVELALFKGASGTISPSFVAKHAGEDLVHGNEILFGRNQNYDKGKVWGQNDHRLDVIFDAVEALVDPERKAEFLIQLGGYLVLDALVGNTDRHHQNWGIVQRSLPDGGFSHILAPTYDHASSLGRELLDERRKGLISSGHVASYTRKGRGGIFLTGTEKKGENPLELVEKTYISKRTYYRPWIDRLKSLDNKAFSDIIHALPEEWISPLAKDFCIQLLDVSLKELRRLEP